MPTALLYLIGVLVFAFGLLLSIALHEIGHMAWAKRFGVKVTQYMVGFGPTLWSRKKGDTEYGVKAIPLGGYIRMIGMVPPARGDGKRSRWPRRMGTAIEDFRQVSRHEVEPGDEPRQFYRLTPGKKMIVMLGGPCMNLVIYLVLTLLVFLLLGAPKDTATTTVGSVTQCVVAANSSDATSDTCPKDAPRAPAYKALQPDDRIVSVDGVRVTSWNQLVALIEPAAGTPLHMVVDRGGKDVPVTVTPVRNRKYVSATSDKTKEAGYLGVSARLDHSYKTLALTAIPGQIGSQLKLGVDTLGRYPAKLKNLYQTVFEGKKRDPQGAVGVVGIGRISGDYARSDLLSAKDKLFTLVELLASVNLLLFFFNLLPLLPLDGGHVAGAIVESAKRGRARLKARGSPAEIGPDGVALRPGRHIFVDTAQMLPVMYGVASVLIIVTLVTLYADIVKPINPLGG